MDLYHSTIVPSTPAKKRVSSPVIESSRLSKPRRIHSEDDSEKVEKVTLDSIGALRAWCTLSPSPRNKNWKKVAKLIKIFVVSLHKMTVIGFSYEEEVHFVGHREISSPKNQSHQRDQFYIELQLLSQCYHLERRQAIYTVMVDLHFW